MAPHSSFSCPSRYPPVKTCATHQKGVWYLLLIETDTPCGNQTAEGILDYSFSINIEQCVCVNFCFLEVSLDSWNTFWLVPFLPGDQLSPQGKPMFIFLDPSPWAGPSAWPWPWLWDFCWLLIWTDTYSNWFLSCMNIHWGKDLGKPIWIFLGPLNQAHPEIDNEDDFLRRGDDGRLERQVDGRGGGRFDQHTGGFPEQQLLCNKLQVTRSFARNAQLVQVDI